MNLFLDTHLNDIVLIIENNNKIIKQIIIKEKYQNSTYIMPNIKKILDGIKLDSIIVVNGPGSFTGVRLGVTIAKTLAYTLNIPIRTITSLECLAVSSSINTKKIVSFSDNNGYYVGKFDENNILIGDYYYLSNLEYNKFLNNNKVLENILVDYLKVIEFAKEKNVINTHKVNPIYIKKIDVEK